MIYKKLLLESFSRAYRNFAPLARSRNGYALFTMLTEESSFRCMLIATEELGLPAVAGIARLCAPHIEVISDVNQRDFFKKFVGAVVCGVMEANGFEKTGQKRAVPPGPERVFRVAEVYRRTGQSRVAQKLRGETYVLDQNALQAPLLVALIKQRPQTRFVLPDAAFLEMSKHPDWKLTFELALKTLAGASDRTYHTIAVGEALQTELEDLTALTPVELIGIEFTTFTRELLSEVGSGVRGPAVEKMDAHYASIRAELLEEELNAEGAKSQTGQLVAPFLKGLKRPLLKAMRNSSLTKDFRLGFIKFNSDELMRKLLSRLGHNEMRIEQFLGQNPMFLRWFYLKVRHSLNWAIRSNPEQVDAHRELNNQLDIEFALTASYFDALITDDNGAREAHEDLKELLGLSPEDAAQSVRHGLVQVGLLTA